MFEFVDANQASFEIAMMCRVLGVSTSGYYGWRDRPPSARAVADEVLTDQIRAVHDQSRQTYGYRRMTAELVDGRGEPVGRHRVARLMRAAGIQGVTRRRFCRTTRRDDTARPAPDLLNRDYSAPGPDRRWVADITFVPTWAGFVFLAVVLDVFSRRVVGWSMSANQRTDLVTNALRMAVARRRPQEVVVHHSDQGCQGGFNRSSQHLTHGGVEWRQCGNGSERSSCIGDRSLPLDGRRWHGARTGSGSGRRLLAA